VLRRAAELFASRAVQMVVLGTGEPQYEALFHGLARRFGKQVTYRPGFSEPLAHQIEAGSDFFLMPSRYEPCGLNQMYSLRYGTAPIVHRTGGLADTVSPFDARRERGTGFVFNHFDEGGLRYGISAALATFGQSRPRIARAWPRSNATACVSARLGRAHRLLRIDLQAAHCLRRRRAHDLVTRSGPSRSR